MALVLPPDIPGDAFTRAGLLAIDGSIFKRQKKVSTDVLIPEIDYIKRNVAQGDLRTQHEWRQVRDACILWCFSYRSETDNNAINGLLTYVGLTNLNVRDHDLIKIFNAIEAKYRESLADPTSPAAWIKHRPPPQRLPTTGNVSQLPLSQPHEHVTMQAYYPTQDAVVPDTPTMISTPRSVPDFNSNPAFQGKYNFSDHRQEYEGYQFQCIFRCLKDGKHCRKAPVREMNRHLRDRHHFRQGFKIAGVDWERKRWRGAGADHKECVGKIVEKDSADDSENDESDLEYTM